MFLDTIANTLGWFIAPAQPPLPAARWLGECWEFPWGLPTWTSDVCQDFPRAPPQISPTVIMSIFGDVRLLLFVHAGTLACDGLSTHSSVTSAATTTLLHDKDQPGYTILDENESDGKGKVDMDSFNGKLSLNKEKGGL